MPTSPTAVICLSPYAGGMELDSIKTAAMLAPFTQTVLIAQSDHFISNEVSARKTDFALETITFNKSLSPAIMIGVRKIIAKYEIRNVIFFGASELKSLYFAFLGLDIDLIIRHGTTKSSPKKDWFHRLIYSDVDYHVAICEHLARNVREIIPFGAKTKLKVIYPSLNLVPSTPIKATERPHEPVRLLHVGRIAAGKGQRAAIEACQVLYEQGIDFTLTLVGGFHEPYKATFLEHLCTMPYNDKIKLIGHTDDVESFYLESDVFLFPSDGEGLSNAFIEALVYGLRCISYENTSFPELRSLGFEFMMVPDQDMVRLRQALLDAVSHDPAETDHGKHNSDLAKRLFGASREAETLLSLLR